MFSKRTLPGSHLQRGNVLFLILIAVALFAAISYVVSQSLRSTGNNNQEAVQLESSQIVQYTIGIKTAFDRLNALGTSGWAIDYSDNLRTNTSAPNANCTSPDCKLYAVRGGSLPAVSLGRKMLSQGFKTAYPGNTNPYTVFYYVPVDGVGTSDPEVVVLVQGMTLPICKALNKKFLGTETLPIQGIGSSPRMSGNLTEYPAPGAPLINASVFKGQMSGCFTGAVGVDYGNFYSVLLAR